MTKRWLLGLGALVLAGALVACGGGDDGDGGGSSDGGSSSGGGGGDQTVEAVDTDDLSYVVMTPLGLSRISAESGDEEPLLSWEDLGLPFGQTLVTPKLIDGLLWGTVGEGHIVAIDLDSGDLERDITFGSTQPISDYGFANGLLWVEAGYEFADAILLGVDIDSGEIMFTVEPPANTTIGGMAAGDEGVWVLGGDPEQASAFTRIDPASGMVDGTFDAGLVVKYISVGAGSVWVGGNEYQFEGKSGDGVVRVDPATGSEIARFEVPGSLRAIVEYGGAIWVADSAGPDFSGAQVLRIDPATNEVTDTIDVGEPSTGALSLVVGDGYVFAVNSDERATYVINAETVEGEVVLTGPYGPVAVQ